MHRPAPRTGIPAKIIKICDKTGGMSARIGRTFRETAAIFGKTTETCEQAVRICDKTRGPSVTTGNNCSVMNTLWPAPDNSNRTGKEIVMISKPIDGIGIRISVPISKSPVAALNTGQATVDRARFAIRE